MEIAKKFLLIASLAVVSLFGFKPEAFAQVTETEAAAGLESCFDYYDYGKVEVNLASEKPVYKTGETAQILGTIVNQNSFPLVDVIVYAQLRRVNTGNVTNEGHHLLERKQITEPMNLLASEARFVKAEFPLLNTYPSGNYQLQYYIVSSNGFHYAGRPFLEEDFAGTSFFEIKDSSAPLIYFNPQSLRVNQKPFSIRGITEEFADPVLNLSAQLIDNRTTKTNLPVVVKFYAFEDTFDNYLISEQKTQSQNGRVNVEFQPPSDGAYVMVMRIDSPTVSEIKFRFAETNSSLPKLRMNDLGVTSFPPTQSDKAYVCIYSPAPTNTAPTLVKLEVLDKNKRVISEKTISSEFSGNVVALALPLGEINDNRDFWVRTIIKVENQSEENIAESHYSCQGFQSSPQDLNISFNSESLSIEAVNSCDQKIGSGGYIESIRIKNNKGEIVQEFYNLDQLKQNIDMKGFPIGDYSAEVKSGKISKNYPFRVTGVSTAPNFWAWLAAALVILLLGLGVFYFRKRKLKLENNPKELI